MSKLFLKLVKLKQSCGKEFHTLFTYLITSFNFQCLSQFHLMSSAFVQKEAMKKKNKTYPYLFLGSLFLADLYLTFCLPSRLKILSLIIYYLKTVSYLCLSILLPFFFCPLTCYISISLLRRGTRIMECFKHKCTTHLYSGTKMFSF